MPSVIDNQDMDSISSSFVNISNIVIKECLTERLGAMKSELEDRSKHDLDALLNQDVPSLIKIWKDIERSENGELNDASDLADLITRQIAEFDKEKLLEMCTLSKIAYGDGDRKLKKDEYKTKRQFEEAGYQIIKFYDNELIQDKYCSESDYKLEQHNVGYALTGSNSYNRDVGYVFIKDKEVTIAYRGTRDLNDLKEDLRASLTKLSFLSGDNYIHSGFYSLFKRSWPSVHKILQGHANDKGLEGIKSLKINVTGHSMGGALATIAALCLDKTEEAKDINVATFGSPRVFYNDAAEVYSECLGKKTIRVACQSDPVPCLPHGNAGAHYKHVGKPLKLETDKVLNYLEPYYHKIDIYYKLIREVKQENFKSDSNASRYFYISYVLSPFYHLINCLLNTCIDDEKFFEEVREENKDIKLSEIPIEYAPKLEEKLKQEEQECDELNDKVATLTKESSKLRKEFDATSTQLTEKEKALDVANGNVLQLQEKLKETQAQLKQEQEQESAKQDLAKITKELKGKETNLEDSKKELDNVNEKVLKLEQEISNQQIKVGNLTTQVTQLTNEKSQLEESLSSTQQDLANKIGEVNTLTEERDQLASEVTQLTNEKNESNNTIKKLGDAKAQVEQKLYQAEQNARTLVDQLNEQNSQLEKELKIAQIEQKERDSTKQELDKRTEELKDARAQLAEKVDELSKAKDLQDLISKFTLIANEKEVLSGEVTHLTEENTQLKGNLKTTTKKNAQLQSELESTRKTLGEENSEVTQLTKGNTQLKNQVQDLRKQLESKNGLEEKLSSIKQDLAVKTKELENADQKVLKLEQEKLSQQASIDNLTGKVTTLTEENTQLQNGLKSTQESLDKKDSQIGNLNSQLKDKCGQFKELNDKLESKSKELNDIQEQLENKSDLENQVKELSGKNKKFSEASTHGKRQGNYASVSFVLSGTFAVGASLTMFHLTICISLAVAALTFLAVGCYCSYKANTALSNVEVDNCVNPAVVEV